MNKYQKLRNKHIKLFKEICEKELLGIFSYKQCRYAIKIAINQLGDDNNILSLRRLLKEGHEKLEKNQEEVFNGES